MASITFPNKLKQLLEGSTLQSHIWTFADTASKILSDNKLPFFPYYTDHGIDHINRVLQSQVDLVPEDVWTKSTGESDPRLLCDADAVVIIGATILHDFAMHLRPAGFLELVSDDTRFKPIAWFDKDHEGHRADRPWPELWQDYVREARRFSDRQLVNIVGPEAALTWKFEGLPKVVGEWTENHHLIVGEFIRRHHARLAHEIAVYWLPGIPPGEFPAFGVNKNHDLHDFADLIGLVARSHGTSLRVCQAYLDQHPQYSSDPRPMRTAVLYPMALLRVADYLQIDGSRAPAVLLQLRDPQSPISVQEWQKHKAVKKFGPSKDPRGWRVIVTDDIPRTLYLQLQDLLAGIQSEIDHSTAVLDEAYGRYTREGLDALNLAIRRVHSNLNTPGFRSNLPYVPERTGFSSDPNLLSLLVEPLYGKEPSVGVRELIQNSVDAVRELDAWCEARGVKKESLDLPDLEADVMVDFTQQDDGQWILRIQDRGIGMTADTIQNYFLRAGASFRNSSAWAKEFTDAEGHSTIPRTGRFGIGAFAIFLLGPSFTLTTRHVHDNSDRGYTCSVSFHEQEIEIHRCESRYIGTTIEVLLTEQAVETLKIGTVNKKGPTHSSTDWYCLSNPSVIRRAWHHDQKLELAQRYVFSPTQTERGPEWSPLHLDEQLQVSWSFQASPRLVCNGFQIEAPSSLNDILSGVHFKWSFSHEFKCPNLIVDDLAGQLPINIQRYGLSTISLPFGQELAEDVYLSFLAWALVCGPEGPEQALFSPIMHPLEERKIRQIDGDEDHHYSQHHWISTNECFIPFSPQLVHVLGATSYVTIGKLYLADEVGRQYFDIPSFLESCMLLPGNSAFTSVNIYIDTSNYVHFDDVATDVLIPEIEGIFSSIQRTGFANQGIFQENYLTVARIAPSERRFDDYSSVFEDTEFVPISADQISANHTRFAYEYPSMLETPRKRPFDLGKLVKDETDLDLFGFILQHDVEAFGAEDSLLATLWLKYLGLRPIPYDPKDREAMIEDACNHPQLQRHVEAWREMKRTGSKWANCQG